MRWAILLQGLDLFTFPIAVSVYGLHGESSALPVLIYRNFGIGGILAMKDLMVMFAVGIAFLAPSSGNSKIHNFTVFTLGLMGLLGLASNINAIRVGL